MRPWPAVFAKSYVGKLSGENVVRTSGFREEVAILERDLEGFKKAHGLDRVVMVNLASTERFLDEQPVHRDLRAFEAGLDANDPAITPAMRYFYAANKLRIPYCNFTPSLTNVPALAKQAAEDRQSVRRHGRQDRADAPQDGACVDVPRSSAPHRRLVLD